MTKIRVINRPSEMESSRPCGKEWSELQRELFFLIAKFLEAGPCQRAAETLKRELAENQLLPQRLDWTGQKHLKTYENLVDENRHISPDYLLKICQRLGPLLDKEVPASVHGVVSLLGAGRQSMLRTKKDISQTYWPGSKHLVQRNGRPLLPPSRLMPSPELSHIYSSYQYGGSIRKAQAFPSKMFGKVTQLSRSLGHLSAVYCVTFDRTGKFIITGADDQLVKIWSSLSGRLIATLRGHAAEITDMAVNYENTLVAAGSCDKLIRVWCLQTTSPIAVLHGHTSMITSLQFCPLMKGEVRYLTSTGADGCVCFWKWQTISRKFDGKPLKFVERSRAGAQMLCASFSSGGIFLATGSSDQVIRVYCLSSGVPEKISELEAHNNTVDSIEYSHCGDRFVSGSKDGTARLWRHERQEWRCMVLNMSTSLPGETNTGTDSSKPKMVTMVGWSNDDQHVVTALSDYTLKVWDSHLGKLVHILKCHEDEVFVVECSPTDPRIMLSAGHDGHIIIWDIYTGTVIKSFYNTIEGQGHGAVFDCKFSPDGLSFAATDSHGYLMLYGFGTNDRYKKCPEEQFFHTDYRPLIRDTNSFVLDEQTQQLPHMMPPPFLVDMDGNPHPAHLQRLVPGREECQDDQLVPQIGVTPSGDREVLDHAVGEIHIDGMDNAGPANNNAEDLPIIDQMIARMQREQDQRADPGRGESHRGEPLASPRREGPVPVSRGPRRSGTTEGVRNTSVSQPQSANQGCVWARRTCVPRLEKSTVKYNEKKHNAIAEEEIRKFIAEKKKKPLPPEEESSSDGNSYMRTRTTKKSSGRDRSRDNEETGRNRLTTRALYDTEVEEDSDDGQGTDDNVWGSSDTSDSESSVYSDWIEDAGMLQPPKRSNRASKKKQVSSSEEEEEEEEQGGTEEKPEPPKKKKPPASKKKASKQQKQRQQKKALEDDNEITELKEEFRPPEWLTETIPRKTPYFPQMGDEVMYFRQGHELYVQAVKKHKVYDINPNKNQPWHKLPRLREVELLRVIGSKVEVKPPRLVCLKLAIIDPDNKKATGGTFSIKYHDMQDVIDFIVLKQYYDVAMSRQWKVNDRFRSMIDDQWWMGRIEAHIPLQEEFPDSFFQCFLVHWDNGETEKMSPWDLEPTDDQRVPAEVGGGIPILPEELKSLMYTPHDGEWPSVGRDAECERIIQGMEQIMQLSVAEPFLAPVDLQAYPLYAIVIEYPIDLSTIKERLENRFYRRISSLLYDVRYIENNAKSFNEPNSHIVRLARLVTELLLRFIKDSSCIDPRPIYNELTQDEDFAIHAQQDSDVDVDGDSDEAGEGTSAGRKRKRADSVPSAAKRMRNESQAPDINAWKERCSQLLENVFQCEDSMPFKTPVDELEYPDYFERISHPMDLSMMQSRLRDGVYESPQDFLKDCKLIFTNSKTYNTNKRSRIYAMTLRLSAMMEDKMKEIIAEWRAAIKYEKTGKVPTSSSRKVNGTTSRSRQNGTGPLTSGPSTSHSHPSSSRSSAQPSTSSHSKSSRSLPTTPRSQTKSAASTSEGSSQKNKAATSKSLREKPGPSKELRKRIVKHESDSDDDDDDEKDSEEESSSSDADDGQDSSSSTDIEVQPRRSTRAVRTPQSSSGRTPHRSKSKSSLSNGHAQYATRCHTGSLKRKRYDQSSEEENVSRIRKKEPVNRISSDSEEDENDEDTDIDANHKDKPDSSSDKGSSSDSDSGSESGSENSDSDSDTEDMAVSTRSSRSRPVLKSSKSRSQSDKGESSKRSSHSPKQPARTPSSAQRSTTKKSGKITTRNQGRRTVHYMEDSDMDDGNGSDNDSPPTITRSSSGRIIKPTARARAMFLD